MRRKSIRREIRKKLGSRTSRRQGTKSRKKSTTKITVVKAQRPRARVNYIEQFVSPEEIPHVG